LLFSAGVLSATASGGIDIPLAPAVCCAAAGALLGSQVGYLIGRRAGPTVFDRHGHPKLAEAAGRAQRQLESYGFAKALVLGRFIPVVRTVVNPLAGALGMPVRAFTLWQAAGGLVWTVGIILAGHQVGTRIPSIDRYLLPGVAAAIGISLVPVLLEVRRAHRGALATPAAQD
jgi:membrane-associated protein